MSSESKHRIILPKNSHVTSLVVDHYHKLSGYSGRQHVLSLIRQKYWVVKANSTVRKVLTNCYKCRRQKAPFCEQKMADLPEDRLIPGNPPFTTVGVDYFGPFLVRRSRSLVKRYGVLFTCLTVAQCISRLPIASTPTRSCLHSGGLSREEATFEK